MLHHSQKRAIARKAYLQRQKRRQNKLKELLDQELDDEIFGSKHRQVIAHANAIGAAVKQASELGGIELGIALLVKVLPKDTSKNAC